MIQIDDTATCPCGSGQAYGSCCGPIHHDGAGLGTTAEQLMRARYSAYVLHDADFLRRSWHPDARPKELSFDPATTWTGLTIESTSGGGGLERTGVVEFTARFERGGSSFELRERSTFERVDGRWLYVDGGDPRALPPD